MAKMGKKGKLAKKTKRSKLKDARKEFERIGLMLRWIWDRYPELYDSIFSENSEVPESARDQFATAKQQQILEALPRVSCAGMDLLGFLAEIIEGGDPLGTRLAAPVEIIIRRRSRKRWWMFWRIF